MLNVLDPGSTELNLQKIDEVHKFKVAKLAGEAALANTELEKAKCKDTIKPAEQAEMEA